MIAEFLQCERCKHYDGVVGCKAFPHIPDEILTDQANHRKPFVGDHGIRWEPKSPGVKHPLDEAK